jgi:hypothetical protein
MGTVRISLEVAILLLIMSLSFRLLSIPLLLVYVALLIFWARHHSNLLLISVFLFFVVSALQPLDVDFGGYALGKRYGTARTGLHIAPFVAGCPAHATLRQHYAEYFCAERWMSPLSPNWILVWN